MGEEPVPLPNFFNLTLAPTVENFPSLLLIVLICLVLLSGFFSATETAFSCASKIKLRTLATNGKDSASKVLTLAEDKFDKLIGAILVGNNIVNLTASALSVLFFQKILSSTANYSLVSTAVITGAVLIFGEVTPKFIASVRPEKCAMLLYPFINIFYYLFYPFNFIFSGWKWLIGKIFRLKKDDKITEEEIMTVVEEAEEDGTIRQEETKLIRSVIEFDDLEVGDILVPRVNIVAVEVSSPLEEIKQVFNKEGYSRLPVYKDKIDTIIGTIHEKDFFNAYLSNAKGIDSILQNAFYTTEHVKISKLLKQLQKNKVHIAVVLDEYGGTLGIVTMEDILEELVGEIWDEHDEEINYIKNVAENVFIADCNMPVSDAFEFFNISEEEDNFDANTLSGFIIEYLAEIPRAGKRFDFKNLTIEILKSAVRRVLSAKITINPPKEEDE